MAKMLTVTVKQKTFTRLWNFIVYKVLPMSDYELDEIVIITLQRADFVGLPMRSLKLQVIARSRYSVYRPKLYGMLTPVTHSLGTCTLMFCTSYHGRPRFPLKTFCIQYP